MTSSNHNNDNREVFIANKKRSNNNVPKGLPAVRKGGRESLNPLLSDEEDSYLKIADKSYESHSLSFGSDASTQTEGLNKKIGCKLM